MYVLFIDRHPYLTILITVGNGCVLKPSELSVATSNLLKELIPLYLDQVKCTLYGLWYMCVCETVNKGRERWRECVRGSVLEDMLCKSA